MVTDELLLEQALDRAAAGGARQAEVFFAEGASDSVDFEANRLQGIDSSSSRGLGIRVLVEGRLGFSSTSILDRVEDAVDAALDTARLTEVEKPGFDLPAGEPIEADISDPAVAGIGVDELMEFGRKAVDRLRPLADGVLAGAGASRWTSHGEIANSAGLRRSCRKSGWQFHAAAQRVEGTSILWCYDGSASMHRDVDVDEAIETTAQKLRQSLKEGVLPAGRHPVVLTPAALSSLLGSLRLGIGARAIYRKTSPLTGRLGEQVLSQLLTIHDDIRPEAGMAGAPFDDEGIAAARLTVLQAGVLETYLADLRNASRLGIQPGRASRAGYASAPFPGSRNWLVEPGDAPLAELLAQAAGGLIVDSLMGMHGSNLVNGDFSANVGLGFAIGPGGETLYRVKDAAIAGNVYELLGARLQALSAERKWGYSGSELMPWALVEGVPIA